MTGDEQLIEMNRNKCVHLSENKKFTVYFYSLPSLSPFIRFMLCIIDCICHFDF